MTRPAFSAEQEWSAWQREAAKLATRTQAASAEIAQIFVGVAQGIEQRARMTDDRVLQRELQQPPIHLEELSSRLLTEGPEALSRRERRALISVPGYLEASSLRALLETSPELVVHAARVCLAHWPRYVVEPWGVDYQAAVLMEKPPSQLLLRVELPVEPLLARHAPDGAAFAAARLFGTCIDEVYEQLRSDWGVRDTWLFSSSVLAAWLTAKARAGRTFIDPDLVAILTHERLRALLLPSPHGATDLPPVRCCVATQAQIVATALAGAHAVPPLVRGPTLSQFVGYLLGSTFLDPRDALRSEGWMQVRRLNESGFRRLLTSLCEQDLDVFFQHAMNEPDRRRFWLRYLSSLERTGCVLDRDVRKGLSAKLQSLPDAHVAIERAHAFKHASGVQAFLLVFSSIVVVEFSDTGNAAYVYSREFFSQEIEPLLRSGKLCNHAALKLPDKAKHRILHGGRWQAAASDWLASEGVHAR